MPMNSYTQELEALIQYELLPIYLRYYRLLNTSPPLTDKQKELLGDVEKGPKLCRLVQPENLDLYVENN